MTNDLQYMSRIDLSIEDRCIGSVVRTRAELAGESPFMYFGGQVYSYRDLNDVTERLASGLHAAGVQKGTHVALLLPNRPETVFVQLALAKLGAISLPINVASRGRVLEHYLTFFDAAFAIVDSQFLAHFSAVQHNTALADNAVAVLRDARSSTHGYHDVQQLCSADVEPLPRVNFNDVAGITFSSGTSGPSKGTLVTHASELSGALGFAQAFGYGPDDKIYVCLPLFHANAYMSGVLAALVSGASIVLSNKFSASRFWGDIRSFGVTRINTLGSMAGILWSRPPRQDDREHHVRTCFSVPVPEYVDGFQERFDVSITSCYSISDYGPIAMLRPDRPVSVRRAAGLVRPEMEAIIVDDRDIEVEPGVSGEICVRSRSPWLAAEGYYKRDDATLSATRHQFFHTADVGHFDENGYLFFDGRMTDSIRRRGEFISTFEVEQIIGSHPSVREVAAYSVPAEFGDEEVMVSVVSRVGLDVKPDELIEFCRTQMSEFMIPRFVEMVSELPRTATQKVEKYRLQESARKRMVQIWDRTTSEG